MAKSKAQSLMGARSKEERKRVRKNLGTLKSLTVQPQTQQRYKASLQQFFQYLRRENLVLPKQRDGLDSIVADYLEYLWSEGEGRAVASNVLAALQDFDPKLKHNLPSSWRLMKTWSIHEVPNRAPPLTDAVLEAMVGWAFFNNYPSFGLSLLVGFFGLLRSGELLALQAWQVHMVSSSSAAVINLGLTKSGKRQGAEESVTLTDVMVLRFLWSWKQRARDHDFLCEKPHKWRDLFQQCLVDLKLTDWGFRPYSLRRGGATSLFVKVGSLDRVLILGRWTAVKTAKIYLNSGLAMLADLKIAPSLLKPFTTVFYSHTTLPKPRLEPGLKKTRAGGRGKRTKRQGQKKEGDLGGGGFFPVFLLKVSRA